ncbi:MAG TPA: glycosyltransferase family 39 protein, partial [Terriglobales bacterium]|nr:glycosyltransferase family 39 protein [Terriglobales bacterium]
MNSLGTAALLALLAGLLLVSHASLLRLPYFWDEAGYYIPAARDLLAGSVIPHSTPSNAHPPLVMAWLAIAWKIFGQKPLVTRCAMLLLAASSLVGFFRLAKAAANTTVAAASTLLTAVYPVFFAQSSLAQIDLPAAGLVFWGLEAYVRRRATSAAVWFSLAALAKETAILVPIALFLWDTVRRFRKAAGEDKPIPAAALISPVVPLAAWYLHHYMRTGYLLGNPEFFRYNVSETLHPLRMVIAFGLRIWQTVAYPNLYVLALACLMAMRFPAVEDANGPRPRIDASIQLAFAAIAGVYLVALSAVGGAVLARYMLPIVPLFILVCVSTIWRRLPMW